MKDNENFQAFCGGIIALCVALFNLTSWPIALIIICVILILVFSNA
jgi:hypothetical protein